VNISLERAVDYLKIKGLLCKSKHKKFLMMYTMSCAVNLQVTEKKRGFKRSRRREKEEKEALRVEREKLKKKRKHDEEVLKQQEVVKASCYSWTCSSG
jgi:hypothetical protein